ncbi:hypothetical protein FEE96_15615 [Parasedimentitalea maritima]|uniref:Uncharacterized protein n=1 Tax=Parasedimentitalea maritima TaxID=2578117 RepID=A0ABY2USF4_9RHOB|nr:hypothetical protein [Zongyanglinia marina]TLP60288.1 hypothetical protein FEE96_15615 [Zongyanglinia marina]
MVCSYMQALAYMRPKERGQWVRGLCAAALSTGLVMSGGSGAGADQRPRAVVTLACDAEPTLCRALVQAMSELVSSHIYRINPDPEPPRALRLSFEMAQDGTACLSWPGGKREVLRVGGHTDTQFARIIVAKGGKNLEKALKDA